MNTGKQKLKVTSDGFIVDVSETYGKTKNISYPALEKEFIVEAVDSAHRLFTIKPYSKEDLLPNELEGTWSKATALRKIESYRARLRTDVSKPTEFPLNCTINPELIKEANIHADNRKSPHEGWMLRVEGNLTHVSKRRGFIAVIDNYLTFDSWSEADTVFKQLGMSLPEGYTKQYKQTYKQ